MIKRNYKRKNSALLALSALSVTPALSTVANADETAEVKFTAPNDVTYTLGKGQLELGNARASLPNSASNAHITNDSDKVLNVTDGVLHAKAGVYTITYTLTYEMDGKTQTKTATQKITILADPNNHSNVSSAVSSASSNASSAVSSTASSNSSHVSSAVSSNSSHVSSAVSSASSTTSSVNSNVSSNASSASSSNASNASSAVNSNVSSAVSNTSSAASSNASNADSNVSTGKTVIIKPDDFLANYLKLATDKGLTGTIDVRLTNGIIMQNGETLTKATVNADGTVTVTNANPQTLAGMVTTTLSNGNILVSDIANGAMTTHVEKGESLINVPADSITPGNITKPSDSQTTKPSDGQTTNSSDGQTAKPSDGQTTNASDGQNTNPSDGQNTNPSDGQDTDNQTTDGQDNDGQTTNPLDGRDTDNQATDSQDKDGQDKDSQANKQENTVQKAKTDSQAVNAVQHETGQAPMQNTSATLPQTGDNSTLATMVGLGILGSASLAELAVSLKKRRIR